MATDNINTSSKFPALWAEHQGQLELYITAAIPDFHAVQDIIQKVAMIAFQKKEQYDSRRTTFGDWIRRIARYQILHYIRDKTRNRHVFDSTTLAKLSVVLESKGTEIDERVSMLELCLSQLQERARQLLKMRYGESLPPTQISELMHTSANTVNVKLSRIRRTLYECVSKRMLAQEKE